MRRSASVLIAASIRCGSIGAIIVPARTIQKREHAPLIGNLRTPASVSLYCDIDRSRNDMLVTRSKREGRRSAYRRTSR